MKKLSTPFGYASLLIAGMLVSACAGTAPHPSFNYTNTSSTASSAPRADGFTLDYLCPDLFEGHVFSCPTVPIVHFAMDRDTDSFGLGVELGCRQHHGGICVSPGIEFGFGQESYGYEFVDFSAPRSAGAANASQVVSNHELEYNVLQLKAQGRYGFVVGGDSALTVSPIAGPRIYRFSYKDCPFATDCNETLIVLDVGVGVQYKNVGVDLFTGINGPNFMARFKYFFAH